MSLNKLTPGECARLVNVEAGQGLKQRLAAMGLVPGVALRIIHNQAWGPLVVEVRGSRIILGRGMADRVTVESSNCSNIDNAPSP